MNIKSGEEQTHSCEPDSCEIHPTPHKSGHLNIKQVQCTPIPTSKGWTTCWWGDQVTPYQSRCSLQIRTKSV